MKIYTIAMFLMMVNLSIAYLCTANILPVQVATMAISESTFRSNIPDEMTYSNADIGLYLFGDFPRAIGMLGKIFVLAPITLPLLMGEAGLPGSIISMFSICLWAVYLVGLAQIIMKYSLESNS
jgi:hypothetical protein